MNNYLREYVDAFHPQEAYTSLNSLWRRSHFYNPGNFSFRNFIEKERENPDKNAIPSNLKKVRVIPRNSLYDDPELFHYDVNFSTTPQDPNYESYYKTLAPMLGENWMQDWLKVQQSSRDTLPITINRPEGSRSQSNTDSLNEESTVQNGDDLATIDESTLEPVWTHAAFPVKPLKPKDSISKTNEEPNMEYFNTNVLHNILGFVKNDTEIEIMFAKSLSREERKRIYFIVNELINGDNVAGYNNVAQMDIVKEIHAQNCYTIATLTEGLAPYRQVSIFKEAPCHIYLVTPDDLRVHQQPEETEDGDEENSQSLVLNPFLKSITKKIMIRPHNNPTQYSSAVTNIIEYFREFTLRPTYIEFRFLGPFTKREVEYINVFLNLVARCIDNQFDGLRQDLVDVYKNIKIKLKIFPDVNGSVMLKKTQTEDKRKIN